MIGSGIIGHLAVFLIVAAILLLAYSQLFASSGMLRTLWGRYVARLQRDVRFLFLKTTGAKIARGQLAVGALLLGASLLLGSGWLFMFVPIVILAPLLSLSRRCHKRRLKIDALLPTWLTTLANALRASPSIGEALASSARQVPKPIQEELDFALKEFQLGVSIDHALRNMRDRINTRNFAAAVATVLIARETGGDLPKILEDSAAALREMQRLEGVLRTKTADGRSQAYLLALLPFILCIILHGMDPTWLAVLTTSLIGYGIIAAAGVLWAGSLFLYLKILAVDM